MSRKIPFASSERSYFLSDILDFVFYCIQVHDLESNFALRPLIESERLNTLAFCRSRTLCRPCQRRRGQPGARAHTDPLGFPLDQEAELSVSVLRDTTTHHRDDRALPLHAGRLN